MIRLLLRLSGRAAVVGCMVAVAFAVRASQTGHGAGVLGLAGLACGLVAWWMLSVILVAALDRIGRMAAPRGDPYEDHPKMSPSVQPSYVQYGRQPTARPG